MTTAFDPELDSIIKTAVTDAYNSGYRSAIDALAKAHARLPQLAISDLLQWASRVLDEAESRDSGNAVRRV
jgi:hypothetical protein